MSHSFKNIEPLSSSITPTLFLPGWGFDGRMLRLMNPSPSWIYPETLLDPETIEQDLLHLVISKNIRKVRLVGWSMGAMLGLQFAARYRELIDSLVLVSLRSHWPGHEIKEIRADLSWNPEEFLKGFYRKCFLGEKKTYRNFRSLLEPLYLAEINKNNGRLQRGLDFLGSFKVPGSLPNVPTRLLHGKQDIIAPVKEMPAFPGAHVEVIDNAGHYIFRQDGSSLMQEFKKQIIRAKFSRAADSYDNYAKVQTEVAQKLSAKLPPTLKKPQIKTILEIGCGTGNFTSMLADRYPAAKIIALDFSPEMITKASRKLKSDTVDFICAEGELFLEEASDKSFDLVASNGSLQWFSDIDKALQNIARILTPGGSMFCSIFGPESLKELGKGLHAIKARSESLAAETFPQPERLLHALNYSFKQGKGEVELIEKKYSSALDLLLHIKKTGTSGWHRKIQQPLTPSRLNLLEKWFIKTYGSCRVTYQILYLQGSNPV